MCEWPTYAELIDRRDVLAFTGDYLPAALDPALAFPNDLVVSTPDLALMQPRLRDIEAELVRSGLWRRVDRVGVSTLYARVGGR